jgi:TRAP-type C4-dicarboxylate transport system substrate-binding protein
MRKTLAILLVLALVFSLVACGGGGTEPEGEEQEVEAKVIKLQGAFPEGATHYYFFDQFCDLVYERSNGTLKVEWGAGPEAIPSDQLGEAMQNGVVELVYSPLTYLTSVAPVLAGVKMTDPLEMRQNGGVEYIDSLTTELLNMRYLGRTAAESPYVIMTNKKIDSIDDFKGQIIRGTSAHKPMLEGVGAEMVTMGWGDVYQAVEKNVITGVGGTLKDFVDNSIGQVVQYLILPGFYCSDASLLIANHVWDELDDVQRQALIDSTIDWETDSARFNSEINAEQIAKIEADGAEVLQLEGELLEQYLKIAYDSAWKVVEDADPDVAARMRSFTSN